MGVKAIYAWAIIIAFFTDVALASSCRLLVLDVKMNHLLSETLGQHSKIENQISAAWKRSDLSRAEKMELHFLIWLENRPELGNAITKSRINKILGHLHERQKAEMKRKETEKETEVEIDSKSSYNPELERIFVSQVGFSKVDFLSTLTHEMRHAIDLGYSKAKVLTIASLISDFIITGIPIMSTATLRIAEHRAVQSQIEILSMIPKEIKRSGVKDLEGYFLSLEKFQGKSMSEIETSIKKTLTSKGELPERQIIKFVTYLTLKSELAGKPLKVGSILNLHGYTYRNIFLNYLKGIYTRVNHFDQTRPRLFSIGAAAGKAWFLYYVLSHLLV